MLIQRCSIEQTWDIHVRAVDVIPWGQIPSFLAIRRGTLLSRPRLVPPGEEHEEEFIDDVRVGDVEVVLQSRNVNIATDLERWLAVEGQRGEGDRGAHVLLDVFLAVLESSLAKLSGDLSGGIIHKLAIGAKDVARAATLLLIGIAAVALLRLRGAWRRGRRSELRHRRYVLRYGVVQRGRLPVVGALHGRFESYTACRGRWQTKWETGVGCDLWSKAGVVDMWSRWPLF